MNKVKFDSMLKEGIFVENRNLLKYDKVVWYDDDILKFVELNHIADDCEAAPIVCHFLFEEPGENDRLIGRIDKEHNRVLIQSFEYIIILNYYEMPDYEEEEE